MKTPRNKPRPRHTQGFTMIEALLSACLASISMIAFLSATSTQRHGTAIAWQRVQATRLAQDGLEQQRIAMAAGFLTPHAAIHRNDTLTAGNTSYTRNLVMAAQSHPDSARALSVTVSWLDRAGQTHQAQLASLIAAPTPHLAPLLMGPTQTAFFGLPAP